MSVKREEFEHFISRHGKRVKLIKNGGFVLIGTVEEVYSDSFLFSTKQESALISFDQVEELRSVNSLRDF